MTPKLPFESIYTPDDPEQARAWFETLERLRTANVKMRLDQQPCGSAGAITGLGTQPHITKGFIEDWLAYRQRRGASTEAGWRWAKIIIAVLAAIAAMIATWPVIRSMWN